MSMQEFKITAETVSLESGIVRPFYPRYRMISELYQNLHGSACLHGGIVQISILFRIRLVPRKRDLT